MWEEIFSKENLVKALKRVERNNGAAGSDGMRIEELRKYLKSHWVEVKEQLGQEIYIPNPVRGVEIPKPNGGKRNLGIPTVLDRFIQQAIAQGLTSLFEAQFSPQSFGYRPGRGAHDVVKKAREYIQEGYVYAVEIDLEKFFDRVNHDILMAKVARIIKDKRVLKLIRRYIEAGVMVNGVVMDRVEGTPQGGPLSPLLANVMLNDFDHELEKRGHKFVRYADDITIYVKSKRAGERVLSSMEKYLEKRLKLKMNKEKSIVVEAMRGKVLGLSFYQVNDKTKKRGKDKGSRGEIKIRVAKPSQKRLKQKLRKLTRRTREGKMETIVKEINTFIKGWMAYYRIATTPSVYENLDAYLRHRLRQMMWKRWKRGKTRFKQLVSLGVPKERAALGVIGKSPWRMAGSPALHEGLNKKYWESQGLESFLARYQHFQIT